jgi:hypothetical protein
MQSAYQIIVADSKEKLSNKNGNLWNSENGVSNHSGQIMYEGKPLKSGLICHWKVRVWDEDGSDSDWSNPAKFEMGLLNRVTRNQRLFRCGMWSANIYYRIHLCKRKTKNVLMFKKFRKSSYNFFKIRG